jgi:2',3'-cyclic-nucleotide 2'-phosphodiesterase (5'-nucleotidase family)
LGGLSKKAFMIKRLGAEPGKSTLVVNGGNLLFKTDTLEPNTLEASKIAADGIMQGTRLMGATLAGVGTRDLGAGIEFLQQYQTPPAFTWLSLNIIDPATRKPLFTPVLRREVAGLKIAVLALTDHEALQDKGNNFKAIPWRETLPDALASLRQDADFILLLSNYDLAENQEIARTCTAVDLILQTGHAVGNMSPLQINQTLISQAETRGKYLGLLDIDWNGHGRWNEANTPQPQPKNGPPSTYTNRFIALKLAIPSDPEIEALVQKTQQRIDNLPKELPR